MTPKSRSSSKIPADTSRPTSRRQSSSNTSIQQRKTSDDSTTTLRVLDRRTNTLETRSLRKVNRGNVTRDRDLSADTDAEDGYAIGNEVQALKRKVGRIEMQLGEILQGSSREGRRKHRRHVEKEDEASTQAREKEFASLQQELESARQELSSIHSRNGDNQVTTSRRRTRQTHSRDHDDVEEIPRLPPGMEARRRPLSRAVTLSGSYNIPLPATVREEDLAAIKRGINSAQNLARNFMDERRTTAAFRNELNTIASSPSEAPTSWTSWIGGYTLSIARAVDRLQLTTTIDSSSASKPKLLHTGGSGGRSDSTSAPQPSTARRKPRKLEVRGGNGKRPVENTRRVKSYAHIEGQF